MKLLNLILVGVCIIAACSDGGQATLAPEPIAWEAAGLSGPESIVFDETRGLLYVSNMQGGPVDKDGKGYITKILPDGSLLKKEWIIGLDAPKGLAVYADTLYVADIDTLVAIDIPSGTIRDRYQVDDAKFLNDVAASPSGQVFVSDMQMNRIHRLSEDGHFEIWLETPELENPNGLLLSGDQLILASWGVMTDGFSTETPGHLKSISVLDGSINSIGGQPVGNLDGVESDGQGGYYVTDWMVGKLFQINESGEATTLYEAEQGMADLEVMLDKKLILLPMMNNNKVLALQLK